MNWIGVVQAVPQFDPAPEAKRTAVLIWPRELQKYNPLLNPRVISVVEHTGVCYYGQIYCRLTLVAGRAYSEPLPEPTEGFVFASLPIQGITHWMPMPEGPE